MKGKKGFTLIELLAVIVIIAIIAVITVPIILNIIDNSKKGAATDSAYGYIESVNRLYYSNSLDIKDGDIEDGYYAVSELKTMGVSVSGREPSDSSWVRILDNEVKNGCLQFDQYKVDITNRNLGEVFKGVCDGLPPEPVAFETDSWATIKRAIDEDNTELYELGDTKEVVIGGVSYTVRLSNISTPAECNTDGFSQTACGFVIEFTGVIDTHKMNFTATNVGGWLVSEMRSYLNTDIYNALPIDLRNVISDTYTVSGHGATTGENNFESIDKLYLLSRNEVLGDNSVTDTSSGRTRQLDYYKINDSALVKSTSWWLRSMYSGYDSSFNIVNISNSTASVLNNYANFSYGVSPAFRIGKD